MTDVKEDFIGFIKFIGLPEAAAAELAAAFAFLCSGGDVVSLAENAVKTGGKDFDAAVNEVKTLAAARGVNEYSAYFVFLALCFIGLKEKYGESYADIAADLRVKASECKAYKGVWGIFVPLWYGQFMSQGIYALGRLQYADALSPLDFLNHGVRVNKGDKIKAIHIPSGAPLGIAAIKSSLKEAYKFFGYEGNAVFVCESWLLFGGYSGVFADGSNIKKFVNLFDVAESVIQDGFPDAWRVFNADYDGDAEKLPSDTRLQKSFIKYLRGGGKCGCGTGFLVFDGENVLSEK